MVESSNGIYNPELCQDSYGWVVVMNDGDKLNRNTDAGWKLCYISWKSCKSILPKNTSDSKM